MPTRRERHIRRLLDKDRARIISHTPFVVQLRYHSEGITQPLIGGMDPGRTNIGASVRTEDGQVVYRAHVETRNRQNQNSWRRENATGRHPDAESGRRGNVI